MHLSVIEEHRENGIKTIFKVNGLTSLINPLLIVLVYGLFYLLGSNEAQTKVSQLR